MIRSVFAFASRAAALAASAQTTLDIAPSDARTVLSVTMTVTSGRPPVTTTTTTSTFVSGLVTGIGRSGQGLPAGALRWQALFSLSAIPAGATIRSATILTAILSTLPYCLHSCGIYASGSGTLTTDVPSVTNGYVHPENTVGTKTIDATAAIRADLATGTPYAGLLVASAYGSGTTSWSAPTLTVTYTVP